ncbi:hypothetical protein H6P81_008053 [Aristolochia fimbriata]|uniref:BTB domain-containing protein n=1 Tax=Aristolochia fimbriata TaxID=158543 RepID=A0AAV7F356_ARIFI|nr:hypothetical protein H6P81_008053 [Aristolochia fimbriata]
MSSTPRSWEIEADLDALDLDPDDYYPSVPLKKVPAGDIFEAARAGDLDRLRYLIDSGVNINARDNWDSVALYYACLAGHLDAARMLLENGAICSEHTFDGDRCHYAALNLSIRRLLKVFEARPPPLGPLEGALRDTFLGCRANGVNLEEPDSYNSPQNNGYTSTNEGSNSYFPPDVIFFVQGRPIEAHRAILSARSPFFKKRFATKWKDRREIRFAGAKLSYPALYSLLHFFYSDRLEILVDEIENLVEICKVCKCESLQKILEKEMILQTHAEYKALGEVDSSQKKFILQGLSLPEEDRLSEGLHQLLQVSLANSNRQIPSSVVANERIRGNEDDLADVYVTVGGRNFRCHQVILASRSEYFKARLSRMANFLEGKDGVPCNSLPSIEEHDLSVEAFEKMLEYMLFQWKFKKNHPDQAEEMFDAASRYLMFPLKRAVADTLLHHLEMESPAELCHWLILSDMYGVLKIREYCLDAIACNFETFADTSEFRAMLLTLPPPSGDSSMRTTLPSAPGATVDSANQGNLLDDLREKWLEAEAAELDKRDESAALFDKRLEILMLVAERERLV